MSHAWIEWFAVGSALLAVGLGVLGLRITWIFWVISSLFYLHIFAEARLWADSALQLVFIAAAIWGWLRWGRQVFSPGLMAMKARLIAIFCACLCWFVVYGLLTILGGHAALGDAFVASFSLIGQVLMVRQRLEHWLFWLVANLTGVGLFWIQGLKATAGLYLFFALLALIGLRQWQKQIDLQVLSSQAAYLPDQGQSADKPISQVRA